MFALVTSVCDMQRMKLFQWSVVIKLLVELVYFVKITFLVLFNVFKFGTPITWDNLTHQYCPLLVLMLMLLMLLLLPLEMTTTIITLSPPTITFHSKLLHSLVLQRCHSNFQLHINCPSFSNMICYAHRYFLQALTRFNVIRLHHHLQRPRRYPLLPNQTIAPLIPHLHSIYPSPHSPPPARHDFKLNLLFKRLGRCFHLANKHFVAFSLPSNVKPHKLIFPISNSRQTF